MFYTYVLLSNKDRNYYTGFTVNLEKRLKEHNSGKVLSTKSRRPFEIVYFEGCLNESDARQRERYLKTGIGKKYLKTRLKRWLVERF